MLEDWTVETWKNYANPLVEKYHERLAEIKPRIAWLFAFANGDDGGPALTKDGHPVAWMAKITDVAARLAGVADVIARIDGEGWMEWSEARRKAVIDSVLHAITIREGFDEAKRPKLRLKQHDIRITGFAEIIDRHGEAAIELVAIREVNERLSQLALPFMQEAQAEKKPKGKKAEKTAALPLGNTNKAEVPEAWRPETVDWRKAKLSAVLGTSLADRLWEAGEMETVGDVADFFANDAEADLGTLAIEPEEVEKTLAGLRRFRSDRGGDILTQFPEEWLTPWEEKPAEPEPEPEAKRAPKNKAPKGKGKGKAATVAVL